MEALRAENISKKFRIFHEPPLTLQKAAHNLIHRKQLYQELWALREVTFSLRKGEALGLIGPNGSGKTTLLRVLADIYFPDSGKVSSNGRLAASLELGSGFLLEFTGLENLYLHGAIFGLSRRQVSQKIPEIAEFSQLNDFMDVPLRQYSFGMRMRLAFALIVNIEPDILLIDESLAVGDLAFRQRCFSKIEELKARGTAFILVSHNLEEIERLSDRMIFLEKGKIKTIGPVKDVLRQYKEYYAHRD